jgi:purine nucleoside phosphorylase
MEKIEIGIIGGSGLYDANMMSNVSNVKKIIKEVVNNIPEERNCICKEALKNAKV